MKINQRLVLFCGLFLGLMSACSDAHEELGGSNGTFSVAAINVNSEAIQSDATSRTGENGEIPSEEDKSIQPSHYKNGFKMDISSFGEVIYSWDSYDEVYHPESGKMQHELRAGKYDASVVLGNMDVEGFNEPSFSGTNTFTIINGMNTELNVTCNLTNSKFRIEYSDRFKGYFSAYSASVVSSLGNDFAFTAESGSLYVKPGTVNVSLKARKSGGAEGTYALGEYILEARHEYVLTLDVDVYSKQMTISFSENVAEENLTIDVSDEALNAKAPTMKATGFASGDQLELVEGGILKTKYQVHVNAQANVKSLMLKTESESPANSVWNNQIDLAQPVSQEVLEMGLKLYGLGGESSQMSMVDLTGLLQSLPKDLPVKFTLSVVDGFNKVGANEIVLSAVSTDAGFSISMPEQTAKFQGNECKLNVSFKQGHFDTMKFKVDGTENYLHITNIETLEPTDGFEHYTLSLAGDENLRFVEPFKLNVRYLGYDLTTEGTCNVGYGILMDDEGDAWAKKAVLHVYHDDMVGLTAQQLVGNEWVEVPSVVNGTDLTVQGLNPDENVSLRVVKNGQDPTNVVVLHTETMLQIPNSNMNDWYFTRPEGVTYWEVWYAGKEGEQPVWNTMNELTTSEGGTNDKTLSGSRDAFRYNANPGTTKISGKEGSAALIRAVGWGRGNGATGAANAKYGTVGELYLGYYDPNTKQPVYSGMKFASRPSKLTFDYKYTPGNGGDSYYAEVIVMNGNEEIGRGLKRDANAKDAWTAETIEIVYSQPQKKATDICVKFKSGDKANNESFLIVPNFGNTSNGEYVGSQLYIDNINLIYE